MEAWKLFTPTLKQVHPVGEKSVSSPCVLQPLQSITPAPPCAQQRAVSCDETHFPPSGRSAYTLYTLDQIISKEELFN